MTIAYFNESYTLHKSDEQIWQIVHSSHFARTSYFLNTHSCIQNKQNVRFLLVSRGKYLCIRVEACKNTFFTSVYVYLMQKPHLYRFVSKFYCRRLSEDKVYLKFELFQDKTKHHAWFIDQKRKAIKNHFESIQNFKLLIIKKKIQITKMRVFKFFLTFNLKSELHWNLSLCFVKLIEK